jgi:hypothetical protein
VIRLLKFISDSFIWIGLCAGGSYIYTCTLLKMPINWVTLLLISSATTALYSFLKVLKKSSIKYKIVSGISSLTAITSLFYSDFNTGYLILIPAGMLGIGYGYIPLYKKTLRSIPFIKVFIISLVWVWVTTVFPIYINFEAFNVEHLVLINSQLLFLVGITVLFDIRDLKHDSSILKTIPQTIGIQSTQRLSLVLITLSSLLILVSICNSDSSQFIFPIVLTSLFSIAVASVSGEKRSYHYYTIIADGVLLFQGIIVLAFL